MNISTSPVPFTPVIAQQQRQLQVQWIPREQVRPNNYNPNRMSQVDRDLLKQSILEDGWTQPIVVLPDYTIVDGEQRWTTAGVEVSLKELDALIAKLIARHDSESIIQRLELSKSRLEEAMAAGYPPIIASLTGGLVPITILELGDEAHQIISTIRHNRARGVHQLSAMTDLTASLVKLGLDNADLGKRLGMGLDEITRFMNSANQAKQALIYTGDNFSPALVSTYVGDYMEQNPDFGALLNLSAGADKKAKEDALSRQARQEQVETRYQDEVKQLEQQTQKPVDQIQKERILTKVEEEIGDDLTYEKTNIHKLVLFFTAEELVLIKKHLGPKYAINLINLLKTLEEKAHE